MREKPRVLFLSTGNSTRSQMAEGFLRSVAGERFVPVSAGIESTSLNPIATEVMKESGIDIAHQKPKDVTQSLRDQFRYVITISDPARERSPIFPSTPNLIHWSVSDPALTEGSDEDVRNAFRGVRDQIRVHVQEFVNEAIEKRKAVAKGA